MGKVIIKTNPGRSLYTEPIHWKSTTWTWLEEGGTAFLDLLDEHHLSLALSSFKSFNPPRPDGIIPNSAHVKGVMQLVSAHLRELHYIMPHSQAQEADNSVAHPEGRKEL